MKFLIALFAVNICFLSLTFAENVKKLIDIDKSIVSWLGQKKLIKSKHFGKIKIKEGHLLINKDGHIQSAEIIIDMGSITCDNIKNKKKNAKLVRHLKHADFFDVEKYPTAHLIVNKFVKTGSLIQELEGETPSEKKQVGVYNAEGALTIKDQTKNLTLKSVNLSQGEIYQARGEIEINRTHWGITYGSDKFIKGLIANRIIADEIQIKFNVVTKK